MATSLTIHDPDLAHALDVLRATPAADLSTIRTLRIILTEASLLRWHGRLWPGAHAALDDEDLDEYARLYYPAPSSTADGGGGGGGDPPSEAFRALLRFVDGSFDVAGLGLEVDAGGAAWGIFEDKAAGAYAGWDEVERDWGFVYEFYLDVGRALAEVFGGGRLRGVRVKTSMRQDGRVLG